MRRPNIRRLSTIGLIVAAFGFGAVALAAPQRVQAATPVAKTGAVEVIKVSGLLDPILADFLSTSLDQAAKDGAVALVLRVDSSNAVISDRRLADLAMKIHDSTVPVVAWIGPSGSRAEGRTAQLVAAAAVVGIAPGSAIGNMGEIVVPRRAWSDAYWMHRATLKHSLVGPAAASAKGLAVAPKKALVLRTMLLQVPGFHANDAHGATATPIQFSELSTTRTMMHTFASPSVAVMLLAIGLALLLFEFYTAGVGVAGVVGAAALIFAFYGLGVLGVRPVAVALVLAAMVAFAIDVQVGVPRIWTAIGSVLFTVGNVLLLANVATPWPATIGSIVAMVLFMATGMPAMTRSRFSTPLIDRNWLVGSEGTVVEALGPDGVIRVDDALWMGRVEGSLPVGAAVRVVGTDGVICQVEVA